MNYLETERKLRDLGFTPDFIAWMVIGAQRFQSVHVRRDPDDTESGVTVSFDRTTREFSITEGAYGQ